MDIMAGAATYGRNIVQEVEQQCRYSCNIQKKNLFSL